jgi:hypothetical protein
MSIYKSEDRKRMIMDNLSYALSDIPSLKPKLKIAASLFQKYSNLVLSDIRGKGTSPRIALPITKFILSKTLCREKILDYIAPIRIRSDEDFFDTSLDIISEGTKRRSLKIMTAQNLLLKIMVLKDNTFIYGINLPVWINNISIVIMTLSDDLLYVPNQDYENVLSLLEINETLEDLYSDLGNISLPGGNHFYQLLNIAECNKIKYGNKF